MNTTNKRYTVVVAVGTGKVREVSRHITSGEARTAMNRVSGIVAVTDPLGRVIASNVRRSFGWDGR